MGRQKGALFLLGLGGKETQPEAGQKIAFYHSGGSARALAIMAKMVEPTGGNPGHESPSAEDCAWGSTDFFKTI
jgi:hypothetical protein